MSQLSDFRRKIIRKSQPEIAAELGYEKWQTYAAQERGENPLPEEIKAKLEKKYKFKGAWPDQEAPPAAGGPYVTREEFGALVDDLEDASEVIRFLLTLVPEGSRPGVLPRKFR